MTRYRVKLRGTPKIIEIEAETAEVIPDPLEPLGPGRRILKDANGKEIACFEGRDIAGFWSEPEDASLAERLNKARLRSKGENQ
jgi:hypothetical protein